MSSKPDDIDFVGEVPTMELLYAVPEAPKESEHEVLAKG